MKFNENLGSRLQNYKFSSALQYLEGEDEEDLLRATDRLAYQLIGIMS